MLLCSHKKKVCKYIWALTERSVCKEIYRKMTTEMDREGFAKVSQWCRQSKLFFLESFDVTQLPHHGCHHTWPMPKIQDCTETEFVAKVSRKIRVKLAKVWAGT